MATFYTGNTGVGTGAHLDFRVFNPSTGKYENPSGYTSYLSSGGNPFEFTITSGFQPEGRVHPVTGKIKPHLGIDYATEIGTPIDIKGGHLLSTWEDASGGIMSQFYVQTENGPREFLMLHGSDQNPITGGAAVTDYDPSKFTSLNTNTDTPVPTPSVTPEEKAQDLLKSYVDMTKAEMNAAYDKMRSEDPVKAAAEGMKMHKAFFGKA